MFFLSPFSQVVKYSSPDGKGIYFRPFSDDAPDGWGEPRVAPDGSPITPGTVGGPHNRTLLNLKNGDYKAASNKYQQKSGNITYWGKYISEDNHSKGRHVLSYYGPRLRYFKDTAFNYGELPDHQEIFYKGQYAAVAPGPVLGAGIRTITETDAITGDPVENVFIFAVCFFGGEDRCYRKRWNYKTIPPYKFTDASRASEQELNDPQTAPNGWELIGTYSKPTDEHYRAETPYFFNQSCTEALHVRRKRFIFDNGSGNDVEEDVFERWAASIGESSFFVSDVGNEQAMEYTETIDKTHPTYNSIDHMGIGHSWQEDHVSVLVTLRGSQYVMGDFIEDQRQWGKLKYNMYRAQKDFYTEGTDPASVPGPGTGGNVSNLGNRFGPRSLDFTEYGYVDPDYVAAPGDHNANTWLSIEEQIRLYYGPEGDEEASWIDLHYYKSGTSDEWAGNPRQDDNVTLYYYEFYTRFMRGFFDIRWLGFFSQDQHKYALFQDPLSPGSSDVTNKYRDILYYEDNQTGDERHNVKFTEDGFLDLGWTIDEMESWDDTFSQVLTRQTYSGKWPDDNHEGEVQVPGNKTFYDDLTGDVRKSWPTIQELLYSLTNSAAKGNGVVTEREELGYSLEVPDLENEGQYVVISDHKPGGDPAGLIGFGEKFYPVGAC